MELQWERKQIPCMRALVREVQNQEQTQEVHLGDDLPDIGRIICGWGQGVIRGKQWQADGMTVSGGVMAWILYAPEDGSVPRCVEAWLPFHMKWNFTAGDRDGVIRVDVKVRSVDARVLSARKMMARATVSVWAEALEPMRVDVYPPVDASPDVQLLMRTYPVSVPAEAGEKMFLVDEDVELNGPKPQKIISCSLRPNLTEQKVVGGKAIFRGECLIHLVYFDEEARVRSAELPVSFAQYADLDRDYDKEAGVTAIMAVSSLEPELLDGAVRIKCGLVAQYVVLDKHMLELAQDAYSTTNQLTAEFTDLEMPVVLDRRSELLRLNQSAPGECYQAVDAWAFWEQPVIRRNGIRVDAEMLGMVQVLCLDEAGQYSAVSIRCSHQWSLEAGEGSDLAVQGIPQSLPSVSYDGTNIHVSLPMEVETITTAWEQFPMITGLQLGQGKQPDPARPSMILRRAGTDTLWNIAKQYGSTVDAIKKANGLEDHHVQGQILLIPVP